ncbi:DUF2254 domain-containing protein [Ruegeria atlantica]|uniref:DUF2254 domain-containing protein n=1 Tax=Ruegeria atlantica TaxID=81569 RepID=A0AA90Z5X1_9RHOB|nr:DUF2254 domain-containing protein [Ruegeria atlantica]NOE20811.1 DUF2254 domain-containing protein [Ruegeria atlantica]
MKQVDWLRLRFLRYYRNMGLRVVLYALLSVLAALISPVVSFFTKSPFGGNLQFESVLPVLTILATSMLAVSTFSLNIMVSAHRAASNATTPRVHRILLADTTTQSVLATFIGAFVFSLGSIVLYQAGGYPAESAFFVMSVTILVVVLVVVSLLRWIDHLTKIGSVDHSLQCATQSARETLKTCLKQPNLGASELTDATVLPDDCAKLKSEQSGYVQLIDIAQLHDALPASGSVYVLVRPGSHVVSGDTLAEVSGSPDSKNMAALAAAFTIGEQRTHEQDAEFGLLVLSEIAAKALSPGINDAGTAIETLQEMKSLLWNYYNDALFAEDKRAAPNVFIRIPDEQCLLAAAFQSLARDGAGMIEVSTKLQEALLKLSESRNQKAASAASELACKALRYAKRSNLLEAEKRQLEQVVSKHQQVETAKF